MGRTCLDVVLLTALHVQLACATNLGFAIIENNSTLHYLCQPIPDSYRSHTRFNDGACDPQGRFVAGTLHSEAHGIPGQLWSYDPTLDKCELLDPGPFTVCHCLLSGLCQVAQSLNCITGFLPTPLDDTSSQDSNGLGWTDNGKTM